MANVKDDTMAFGDVSEGMPFRYAQHEYHKTHEKTLICGTTINAVRDDGSFWYFELEEDVNV